VKAVRTPRLFLAVALAAATQAPAATAPAAAPAEWRTYAVLVDFTELPRTYSCDDLWYKFRDVLLKLGARAYMTITPYQCGVRGGGEARSPQVEVKFQLPQPLHGDAVRYAQISAGDETIKLAPGSPRSLGPDDCELVRQMQQGLLAALPVHVTSSEFRCSGAAESFTVTLDAVIAAPPSAGRPAGPSAAARPAAHA
jgi:hypothetical protein